MQVQILRIVESGGPDLPGPQTGPHSVRDDNFMRLNFTLLDADRRAELLRQDAAHDLGERLAGLFQDEGVCRVRPGELEAGGQRGNPDLPHGRVRTDDEPRLFRLFEQDFQLTAFAFYVEPVLIRQLEQAATQCFQRPVAFVVELALVHTRCRLSHQIDARQVIQGIPETGLDIHIHHVYIHFPEGTRMHRRLNVTLPEETVRIIDRLAKKGKRSRLIAEAVSHYVQSRARARLRKRIKQGALRRAARDLQLAAGWFPLEEELWHRGQG